MNAVGKIGKNKATALAGVGAARLLQTHPKEGGAASDRDVPQAGSGILPVITDGEHKTPVAERRKGNRRDKAPDRTFSPLDFDESEAELLPPSWRFVVLAMIFATILSYTLTRAWPGSMALYPLLGSILGAGLLGIFRNRLMRKNGELHRLFAASAAVLPLFAFGFGITAWVKQDGLPWDAAIAILLGVGAISATYLRRHPGMILATQAAIWSAVLVSTSSMLGLAGLLIAGLFASLLTQEQMHEAKKENRLRIAREQAQTRAREILFDYEETKQGWFWETDRRSQITYVSAPVAAILGAKPEELVGLPLVNLFDLENSEGSGERALFFHLSSRSAFQELAVRAATNSEDRWWSVSGRPVYDEYNNFNGFRGSGTDLTERKRSEDKVTRLANFDSLTGLANRFKISQILEGILSSRREESRDCAIFLIDLDRFKLVNDTMGHPAGDALLKIVARRLERGVGDLGQVGRIGGDEFKVVLVGQHARNVLTDLASDLIQSLSQPYSIEGQNVVIGASIGIAIAPEDGTNVEEIVRSADLALYAAKDAGRGRYHFYTKDLHAEAEARSALEEDLRNAMQNGEMQLFYQPIVATANSRISGFEALLRWHHPKMGWISPEQFIDVAEDTGLIEQLGEWALRKACSDLATMPEKVRMAVNVSPLQFANPNLPALVTQAIAQSGISPRQLELEITESVFLDDDDGTDAMFKALKRIGVRLALDDFGTGYASLGYLKKAPFDKIKIDQSFVRGATEESSRNGAIIASITSLAKALGMETTAEGVETLEELEIVRSHGCSHVQGYVFERPLDHAAAIERLQSGLDAVARGPRSSRAPRQAMLRKVVLDHQGKFYDARIRNISTTGALIEGLWNVPAGTTFIAQISQDFSVACTVCWNNENRMGVKFANPLYRDAKGHLLAVEAPPPLPAGQRAVI